jgi:type I restriction enzyme S subunit
MSTEIKQLEEQKIPKLRFSGFSGKWEEKKLGEIAKFWNGKAHEQNICENGKYIVINSKEIVQSARNKYFNDENTNNRRIKLY